MAINPVVMQYVNAANNIGLHPKSQEVAEAELRMRGAKQMNGRTRAVNRTVT